MTRYVCGYVCWQERDGTDWVDRRQFLYGVPCTDMLTLYAQAQVEHVLRELYSLRVRLDHHTDDDGAEKPWCEIFVQDTWPDTTCPACGGSGDAYAWNDTHTPREERQLASEQPCRTCNGAGRIDA